MGNADPEHVTEAVWKWDVMGWPLGDPLTPEPIVSRYPDGGADLPGQGPVCQAGAGGGSTRRGSNGNRDPQLHHQGTRGPQTHTGQPCLTYGLHCGLQMDGSG